MVDADRARHSKRPTPGLSVVAVDRLWKYWVIDLAQRRYARVTITETAPPDARVATGNTSPWATGVWHPLVGCRLYGRWLIVELPEPADPLFVRLHADSRRAKEFSAVFGLTTRGRAWVSDFPPTDLCVLIEDHTHPLSIGD